MATKSAAPEILNLSMNSGNETAVDSIVGLKLDYAGKDGWSATATLEGGPKPELQPRASVQRHYRVRRVNRSAWMTVKKAAALMVWQPSA
ncbi:surface-exposed virulence protein BigA [Salmonella enterica subsp. enterica]|uniref:Surface-exposed virulence protein BigA n=1 Tax=Salmonella enterica I TaxID=59201 RepID=A0A3S4HZA2_SALET|nr:surface-exposed virulence protein BigA [Salmonella enterica subsp. enterica]